MNQHCHSLLYTFSKKRNLHPHRLIWHLKKGAMSQGKDRLPTTFFQRTLLVSFRGMISCWGSFDGNNFRDTPWVASFLDPKLQNWVSNTYVARASQILTVLKADALATFRVQIDDWSWLYSSVLEGCYWFDVEQVASPKACGVGDASFWEHYWWAVSHALNCHFWPFFA